MSEGRITPEQVDDPDPYRRAAVAAAWNGGGGAVFGAVDDAGRLTLTDIRGRDLGRVEDPERMGEAAAARRLRRDRLAFLWRALAVLCLLAAAVNALACIGELAPGIPGRPGLDGVMAVVATGLAWHARGRALHFDEASD